MKFKFLYLIFIFTAFNYNFLKAFILSNDTLSEVSGMILKQQIKYRDMKKQNFKLKAGEKLEITLRTSDYVTIFAQISDDIVTKFVTENKSKEELNSKDLIFSIIQKDKDKIEIIEKKA